jgi:hypothetical protein
VLERRPRRLPATVDAGGAHTMGAVTVQVIIGGKANLLGPSLTLVAPPPRGSRW